MPDSDAGVDVTTVNAMSLDGAVAALADRMAVAIQAGDVDGWGAEFAADATCWHSYDGVDMPATQNVEMLRGLFTHVVTELRYHDIRRFAITDGFVQQHTLTMRAHNGATYSAGVCVVVQLGGGSVTRLEEYLDSGVIEFGMANQNRPSEPVS